MKCGCEVRIESGSESEKWGKIIPSSLLIPDTHPTSHPHPN